MNQKAGDPQCRTCRIFIPAPSMGAIAFGFCDLSVVVIPAEAGIQRPKTRHSPLDSRLRGNDRGEKGNTLAKCDCAAIEGAGEECSLQLSRACRSGCAHSARFLRAP